MEALTRLVSESLARHGFDRPLDYRRLHWSRWFRCDSQHSLLFVPSKPGVFAVAEEIMDFGDVPKSHQDRPDPGAVDSTPASTRRMLAVTQFFEDDDMAFVLDRMLSRQNPMRARLLSGRYFVRFVVIDDQAQRRSICTALNQWIITATEKTTGIGSHFASSLELTPATEFVPAANDAQPALFPSEIGMPTCPEPQSGRPAPTAGPLALSPLFANASGSTYSRQAAPVEIDPAIAHTKAPQIDSGAATNIHCPSPFPSGF